MKYRLFSGHVRHVAMILTYLLLFCSSEALATTYCVSNVGELQDALYFTEDNGEDDTIKLVQGTYTDTFIFSSTEEHNLTLLGGFTAGCAARFINPANTTLDGDNSGPVLILKSTQPVTFELSGLTLQNGLTTSNPNGAGLYLETSAGTALLSDLIAQNNQANGSGGGLYIAGKDATLTKVSILSNHALGGAGGMSIVSTGANIYNCAISGNSGTIAGGIDLSGSGNVTVGKTTIAGNTSSSACGGTGGISLSSFSKASLQGNVAINNRGAGGMGGISIHGCGVVDVNNNIIQSNVSTGSP